MADYHIKMAVLIDFWLHAATDTQMASVTKCSARGQLNWKLLLTTYMHCCAHRSVHTIMCCVMSLTINFVSTFTDQAI